MSHQRRDELFGTLLPSRLADLAREQASGVLRVVTDDGRREVVFTDGEIRAARSEQEEERLGRWLVDRGLLTEDQRALTLLAQGGENAAPFGHILVTRGHLSQERLEAELAELAMAIICRAAAATRPMLELRPNAGAEQLDTLPELTTPQIILIAARAVTDVSRMRTVIGDPSRPLRAARPLDDLLETLDLTPQEAYLLSRLDGRRSFADLERVVPMTAEQVVTATYALLTSGAVAPGRALHPTPVDGFRPTRSAVKPEQLSPAQRADRDDVLAVAERLPRMDHYAALGMLRGARAKEIRDTWERLSVRYRPERSAEPHLADLRQQLEAIHDRMNEAFRTLGDESRRRRYDELLDAPEERTWEAQPSPEERRPDPDARRQLVEANIAHARRLAEGGDVFMAVRLLEEACSLEPRAGALLDLARLQMRNPLWFQRALTSVRKAVELEPRRIEGWLELADLWKQRGDPERQRKSLERALAIDPHDLRAQEAYRGLRGEAELKRFVERAIAAARLAGGGSR